MNTVGKKMSQFVFFCDNKLKIPIALFPDVVKSALQKLHIKLNTNIWNGEKVKNKI